MSLKKNILYILNIDNNKFKKIINLFNERIWKEVIENRDGVELPDSLGYIFIGTCPAAKSVNMIMHYLKNMVKSYKIKTGRLMVKLQKYFILIILLSIPF